MFETMSISRLDDFITCEFDLFICFNSFEKRCTSIASHIPTDKFRAFLVLTNQLHLENEDNNLQELTNLFADKASVLRVDLSAPIVVADKIIDRLNYINERTPLNRIFVDITTFTHETLLILVAILNEKYNNAEIIWGYNNAKEYSPDINDPKKKWLSRGIGDVRSILGYSGDLKPSLDNLLIVIVGYEYERAARIIDAIAPDYLAIGYNNESNSSTEKNQDANEGYAKLLKNMSAYFEQTIDFVVPSNDPFKAYEAICNELDTIGKNVNITIVPMNNKLSTMGVALVGLRRPEIQICYAPALVYNTSSYSSPGDTCYIFSFNTHKQEENHPQEVQNESN